MDFDVFRRSADFACIRQETGYQLVPGVMETISIEGNVFDDHNRVWRQGESTELCVQRSFPFSFNGNR